MNQGDFRCYYGIGACAKTKEYSFYNSSFWIPLEKQEELSYPIITSVTLKQNEKEQSKNLFSIYVGKEFLFRYLTEHVIEKYHLDQEELKELYQAGFERFCLLNYKKDNAILVGLRKDDKVVSDYFTLRQNLIQYENTQIEYLEEI